MSGELLEVVKQVGPTTGIAVFLVWRLAAGFDSVELKLGAIFDQQIATNTRMAAMEQSHQSLKDIQAQLLVTQERTLWVLRQSCVQNANDSEARRRCLSNGPQD